MSNIGNEGNGCGCDNDNVNTVDDDPVLQPQPSPHIPSAPSLSSGSGVTNPNMNGDDDNVDNFLTTTDSPHDAAIAAAVATTTTAAAAAALDGIGSSAITSSSSSSSSAFTTTVTRTTTTPINETNIPRLCVAFLASITTGGTTYAFGIYGNALKKNLHLTESQLDTISTANFVAGAFSWIPGLLVDYFGTRFGISMGGILGSTALMAYWHVAKFGLTVSPFTDGWIMAESVLSQSLSIHDDSTVESLSSSSSSSLMMNIGSTTQEDENHDWMIVATLSALGVAIFLSCSLITGSVFKIIVNSCGPGSKGSAVGVAKGYVGLGAGAYACFFEAIRQPQTTDLEFLPMCAAFFLLAAVLPSWFILPTKQQEVERQERQRLLQVEQQQQQQQSMTPSQQQQPLSSATTTNMPDVTTSRHFQVLFSSLILMASAIVGSALMTLYRSSDEHKHVEDVEEDEFLFEGSNDHGYTFPITKSTIATTSINGITNNNSSTIDEQNDDPTIGGPNYPLAIFLLFVWIAPIVSLVFLPQGADHFSTAALPQVMDDMSDEEQETLLELNRASAEDDGHTDAKKSTTNAPSRNKLMSSTPVDNFATEDVLQQQEEEVEDVEGNVQDDNDNVDNEETAHNNNNNNDIRDKTLFQVLFTPEAWLLLFTATILVGGGTVETNNLGQMIESLRFPDIVTPAALALFSVAQSLSRALTGAISETALNKWTSCHGRCCGTDHGGVPRPVFLLLASVAGFIAHSLLAVSTTLGPFVVGVFLSGAAFGMVWPLMVLIVGEVFGTAHMAANYMFFDGFTLAGGTLLLSKVLAQDVYERHIKMMTFLFPSVGVVDASSSMAAFKQREEVEFFGNLLQEGGDDDGHVVEFDRHSNIMMGDAAEGDVFGIGDNNSVTCYGQECFRMTHVIIAGLSLLCVFSSIAMQYATRHIYNNKSNLQNRQ